MKKIALFLIVIVVIALSVYYITTRQNNNTNTEDKSYRNTQQYQVEDEVSTQIDKNASTEDNIDSSVKEIEDAIKDVNVELDFIEIGDI